MKKTYPFNLNGQIEVECDEDILEEDIREALSDLLNNHIKKVKGKSARGCDVTNFSANSWFEQGAVNVGNLHFYVEHAPDQDESISHITLKPDQTEPGHNLFRSSLNICVSPSEVNILANRPGTNIEDPMVNISIKNGSLHSSLWNADTHELEGHSTSITHILERN